MILYITVYQYYNKYRIRGMFMAFSVIEFKQLKQTIMRNTTNTIDVAQKYRTNSLSHTPGGYRIAVIMK
ncbi:MAG: hypothetical protein DRI86_08120, partial [Bacteroidetes bacterium]